MCLTVCGLLKTQQGWNIRWWWLQRTERAKRKLKNRPRCRLIACSSSLWTFITLFPLPCVSPQSVKQSVSKAVSRFVPVWLKHYLRGFATLFLKRSDILSQPPLLPTGKLKMPQSPQATRFIYLHTYWVREAETDRERGGEGDLSVLSEGGLSFLLHTLNKFLYKFAWYANSLSHLKKIKNKVSGPQCSFKTPWPLKAALWRTLGTFSGLIWAV